MNTALIIVAIALVLAGIAGSIIPGIPGPPLSWVGLLLLHLSSAAEFSTTFLIVTALAAAIITVLDYVVPSYFTKRNGGGKGGVWGCNIGLVISIIGLPFGPQGLIGVIFWPFIGALVGEMISGKQSREALSAAWGAFLGFLTGTGLKLVYGIFTLIMVIKELVA